MKRRILVGILFGLLTSFNIFGSDAPNLLPFQGRLTDQAGNAVTNGVRLVQFKIYDVPTGGNPIWAGELHRTTVNGGLVSALLGTKTPFTSVDFDRQLYLEIIVDINGDNTITAADPPMLPRQVILPTIFAKEAADSRLLDGYDWSSLFVEGAANPTTAKINGNRLVAQSITSAQIANQTLTSAQIAPQTITAVQMASATITHSQIASETITGNQIANGTIDISDLAQQVAEALVPPGTIVSFGGTNVPSGWLLCSGSAVSRSQYSRLFIAIGSTWGNGDGGTTFNVPDLRGYFLRGADGAAGRDPDSGSRTNNSGAIVGNKIGSYQSDAVQGHNHTLYYRTGGGFAASGPGTSGIMIRLPPLETENTDGPTKAVKEPSTDGTHGIPRISTETRPINVYVNYIIKY